jgi:hypothetical protein
LLDSCTFCCCSACFLHRTIATIPTATRIETTAVAFISYVHRSTGEPLTEDGSDSAGNTTAGPRERSSKKRRCTVLVIRVRLCLCTRRFLLVGLAIRGSLERTHQLKSRSEMKLDRRLPSISQLQLQGDRTAVTPRWSSPHGPSQSRTCLQSSMPSNEVWSSKPGELQTRDLPSSGYPLSPEGCCTSTYLRASEGEEGDGARRRKAVVSMATENRGAGNDHPSCWM